MQPFPFGIPFPCWKKRIAFSGLRVTDHSQREIPLGAPEFRGECAHNHGDFGRGQFECLGDARFQCDRGLPFGCPHKCGVLDCLFKPALQTLFDGNLGPRPLGLLTRARKTTESIEPLCYHDEAPFKGLRGDQQGGLRTSASSLREWSLQTTFLVMENE